MIGVYKITFPNGVYYIGQSIDLNTRHKRHIVESKKGKHSNPRFQYCWNKYGELKFEILEECEKGDLNRIESSYIIKHIDLSRKGCIVSEETRDKLRNYNKIIGKSKPVYMFTKDFDLLGRYESIVEAEKSVNANPKDVQKSCKNRGKYNVKGYKFLYAAEVDIFLNYAKEMVKL
jgi:predicted GIY-YIG superfamily endonuclease